MAEHAQQFHASVEERSRGRGIPLHDDRYYFFLLKKFARIFKLERKG